jgi:peptidoglycan biosynthesis protein MviN/MurJ (putative lipid II flippase)
MGLTAATLAAYSPIIVTLMMLPILVGSLNARRQGGMLLLGGVLNVILNIVLDVVFAYWFGAPGIALATSVAEIFVVAVFIRSMARSGDRIDLRPFVRTIGRATLAIAPFAAVIGILGWNRFGTADTLSAALALAAAAVVGVGGYVVLASRLGIGEAQQVLAGIGERVLRIRPVAPPP